MRSPFYLIKLARWLFHYGTKPLTINEKEGLRLSVRGVLRYPGKLTLMLVTGLVAAVFEGGTLGLLGVSVNVLTDDKNTIMGGLPDYLHDDIATYLESISRGGLFLLCVGFAVLAQIVKGVMTYVSTVAQVWLGYQVFQDGQDYATNHVMAMSYRQVAKYPSGQLASLIDQSGVIADVVTELGKASRALLMTISYAGVMLIMSPILTLSALAVFLFLWIALTGIVKTLKRLSSTSISSEIDTWRWSVEYLNVPRLLRVFGTTNQAENVIKVARHKRVAADRQSSIINAAILPSFEVITVFGAGIFLVSGYLLSGDSAIDVVPGLFVFVLVFFRLKPQVKLLNDLRIAIAKLLPRLATVGEFLRRNDKEYGRIGGVSFKRLSSGIKFHGVSFCYDESDSNAVSNLDFCIPTGHTVAFVGSSGSGKSTVVNLLLDLYQPNLGQILVDGEDLNKIDSVTWRKRIGVVDQEVYLLNASIEENIRFGREDVNDEDIKHAAKSALADEFIQSMEFGYDTVVGDRGYKLSGGQQQRIALARALVGNPDILVLDEATSALDSISERYIQKAIESMHRSRTILLIAHRLSTVSKADQIFVLEEGNIVQSGTKDELLRKEGTFLTMWATQHS